MARPKRPHVPKVRGCHECSQRRIHCDRGRPSCAKCVAKGVSCSGLGVRYRFSQDVLLKGRTCGKREATPYRLEATIIAKIHRLEENELVVKHHTDAEPGLETCDIHTNTSPRRRSSSFYSQDGVLLAATTSTSDVYEELTSLTTSQLPLITAAGEWATMPTTLTDALDSWERYFLLYFSQRIAPMMVVIDDHRNGWRHLVLPVAHLDVLVRDAVLAASVFHFSINVQDQMFNASTVYQRTIHRLQQRPHLDTHDTAEKQSVVLTLLVLLAAVMVNGSADFHTLFKLLETALSAIGGEEALDGELGVFLLRQIWKLRGYAAPLLSQAEGVARLSLTTSVRPSSANGWECFRSYYHLYPNLSAPMSLIYDLNEQACHIYMARVLAGPNGPALTGLVDRFTDTMELLAPGSPGEHTLAWPTFIAASECTTKEQQQYFEDVLTKLHQRSGFANIPAALQHLRLIWSGQTTQDWTNLLPELQVFIV